MVDDGVRYELKTVKALRGTEGRSTAKWQKEGWELVDKSTGTLHTTLNFRKPKPPLPVRQIVIGAAAALVLAGIIGVGALLEGDGDGKDSRSADPTPVATEQPGSPSAPVATEQPGSPSAQITNITVDELLDRLNSAGMGGIKNGDQFRFTGELSGSDYWGTGASGEFTVYLTAKGGANDLMVFVDESDAAGWQDGTWVEMVVESGETTINGETTDGWLRAQSVTTVPGR
ncbi:hypothetical protein [Blastococcus atacamensis]|uniref:hypothetical protein n=1 Tax=Blastococcus atacamensis TaxID=2070508 RepID=UPI000CECB5B0|nr:hypothetical protein [Blastococcus atacamensis]